MQTAYLNCILGAHFSHLSLVIIMHADRKINGKNKGKNIGEKILSVSCFLGKKTKQKTIAKFFIEFVEAHRRG